MIPYWRTPAHNPAGPHCRRMRHIITLQSATAPSEIEACLNAFFDEPHNPSHLPFDPVGSIFAARPLPDQDGMAVIGFSIQSRKGTGETHQCKANPAEYAFLVAAQVTGLSVFIDRTNDRSYLKLGGQMDKSAGIVVGRLCAGHEEGEVTIYLNDDRLDIRHANLGLGNSQRAKRGRFDIYEAILIQVVKLNCTPEEFQRKKNLLHRAFECLDAEAEIAARA